MNLIPGKRLYETGDYFCTWGTQGNWFSPRPGEDTDDSGCRYTRNGINSRYLFSRGGALAAIPRDIRGDLHVVIDDGWDVPYDTKNPENMEAFGSCAPDGKRFPGTGRTAAERLFNLSSRVKAMGFLGLGLWISIQVPGENRERVLSLDEFTAHWEENARICGEAGITYWKVDWGRHSGSAQFRRAMSQSVRRFAPSLLIEHAYVTGPISESAEERKTDKFREKLGVIEETIQASDYYRTYDVMFELDHPATLIRLRDVFGLRAPNADGHRHIINVEYMCALGAALGCSLGVMQHPARSPEAQADIRRALAWHRLAPPFAIEKTPVYISDNELTDSWKYEGDPSVWPHYAGQIKMQSAPAAISRNAPLPELLSEDVSPYLVCAKNPFTGCFSVAALPRTAPGALKKSAPARVRAYPGDPKKPVGIFGDYTSLELVFERGIENKKVIAQDLAGKAAQDITSLAVLNGRALTLPGELISKIGLSALPEGMAGMALKLV